MHVLMPCTCHMSLRHSVRYLRRTLADGTDVAFHPIIMAANNDLLLSVRLQLYTIDVTNAENQVFEYNRDSDKLHEWRW